MTDNTASERAKFASKLRTQRLLHGQETLETIACASKISKATASRLFSGTSVPRWMFVAPLLKTMGVPEDEISGAWKIMWARAYAEYMKLDSQLPESGDGAVKGSPSTAPLHIIGGQQQPDTGGTSRRTA